MKKYFKLIGLILSSLFLVVLAACGGGSASGAKKVNIGDTKEKVEEILGTPYSKGSTYEYYSSNMLDLVKESDKLSEQMMMVESEKELENILKKGEELEKKIESLEFSYTKIAFDNNGLVEEVFANPKAKYDLNNDDVAKAKLIVAEIETNASEASVGYVLDERKEDSSKYIFVGSNSYINCDIKYENGAIHKVKLSVQGCKRSVEGATVQVELYDDYDSSFSRKVSCIGKQVGKIDKDGILVELDSSIDSKFIENDIKDASQTLLSNFSKMKYEYNGYTYEGYAFNHFYKLIKVGSSVTTFEPNPRTVEIDNNAFVDCNITSAIADASCVNLLPKDKIKNLTINSGDASNINFKDFKNLEKLIIGKEVKYDSIDPNTLPNSLINVTINSNITSIPDKCFSSFSSLKYFKMSNTVTSIGDEAFFNCANLEEVIMSESITTIGRSAFVSCSKLSSITIPKDVNSIGHDAFYNCQGLKTVYYNNSMDKWFNVSIDSNPMVYAEKFYNLDSNGKVNYNGNKYSLVSELIIPINTKTISKNQFNGFAQLTKVVFNSELNEIDEYAFANCTGLEEINIVNKEIQIASTAFFGTKPKKASIPSNVKIDTTSIEEINFYSGETIGRSFFIDCETITCISLSNSINKVNESAFKGCKNISEVYYNGTINDWLNITFEDLDSNPLLYGGKLYILDETGTIEKNSKKYRQVTKLSLDNIRNIGNYQFAGLNTLTELTFDNSIKEIGDSAFYNCQSIETIKFSNILESIGDKAFYNCKNLETISELNVIKSIGAEAFSQCIKLKSVSFSNTLENIGDQAFYKCSALSTMLLPDSLKTVGTKVLFGCLGLTNLVIEDGVPYSISSEEFMSSGLVTVKLGNAVKEICSDAFKDCESLIEINIPSSVEEIGYKAFYGCISLKNIEIPEGVKEVKDDAFEKCESLISFKIGDGVSMDFDEDSLKSSKDLKEVYFGDGVFTSSSKIFSGYSKLTKVRLSKLMTYINVETFMNCTSLKEVVIPYGVEEILDKAFSGCTSLASIDIPDTVTFIGSKVFSSCASLEEITLPKNLKKLGSGSFSGCTKLKRLEIGSNVEFEVSTKEFYLCTELETLVLPNTIKTIENEAFYGCTKLKNLSIPSSVNSIGTNVFNGCDNLEYNEYDDCNYVGDTNNPYLILLKGSTKTTCSIHENCKFIYYEAFRASDSMLKNIVIPDSVISISGYAFLNCKNLTDVTLSKNLQTIFAGAFEGCTKLNYNVYDDCKYLGTSDNKYFALIKGYNKETSEINENCKIIGASAYENMSKLETIVIPSNVSYICDKAFYQTGITNVTIPSNVLYIGTYAFDANYLKKLKYNGTVENWNKISYYSIHVDRYKVFTVNCEDGNVRIIG